MKTAIVIGATGITGKPLTKKLLASGHYSKVIAFTRRTLGFKHPKLVNHVVDFDAMPEWSALVQGDDLFAAMGTTLSQAGNKNAQYRVDYSYQAGVIEAPLPMGLRVCFWFPHPRLQ